MNVLYLLSLGDYTLTSVVVSSSAGKCYSVTSQKSLIKSLEAIAQKMHPGVVVCFRKIGFTPPEEGSRSRPESPTVFEMEVGSKDPTKTEAEPTPTGLVSGKAFLCAVYLYYVLVCI